MAQKPQHDSVQSTAQMPGGGDLLVQVETAAAPIFADLGLEIVHLEREGRILRIYIDRQGSAQAPAESAGKNGVTVDDCALASRTLSDLLDAEGLTDRVAAAFGGSFNLEMSSPGLDRPLVKPAHFQRFIGEEIKVKTKIALPFGEQGTRRSFRGVLAQAASEPSGDIAMEVDGVQCAIAYENIERARLVPKY